MTPNDIQRYEQLQQLENKLRDWISTYQPRCDESLYQVDGVRDGFEELAEIVCDDLGYYDDSDEDKQVQEEPVMENNDVLVTWLRCFDDDEKDQRVANRCADALEQAQTRITKLEETKYAPPALEVIDGKMSDKSQDADWLRARYFEGTERIEQLEAALVWLYNQGYQAGHHDTVESMFTDVLPCDMETYQDDVVADLMEGRGMVDWAKSTLLAEDKQVQDDE